MTTHPIIGIGACVMDTLITVPRYPDEDTKMPASAVCYAGGGPAATGLVAAAKLGMPTAFAGLLAQDRGGEFLFDDFTKYGVSTALIRKMPGFRSFSSTILLSEKEATRTCVFDRGDLPPLTLDEEQRAAIRGAALLLIDGNELAAAETACQIARENRVPVLYDCGGLYPHVERLLALTDIMIPSAEFARRHTGKNDIRDAAKELFARYHPRVVVITCGKLGGIYFDGQTFWPYPAFDVRAKDTNGAGDVFHGAFAAGILRGYDERHCCIYASAVSAIKCTGLGARESIPSHTAAVCFLREQGYDF